jgi:hypothetical protein
MLKLFLSLLSILVQVIALYQRNSWINEGYRRALAEQVAQINASLVHALQIEKEWEELTDEQVRKRFEEKGWFAE